MTDEDFPIVDARYWRLLTAEDYGPPTGGTPLPANLCLRCGTRIYGYDVRIHDNWHTEINEIVEAIRGLADWQLGPEPEKDA